MNTWSYLFQSDQFYQEMINGGYTRRELESKWRKLGLDAFLNSEKRADRYFRCYMKNDGTLTERVKDDIDKMSI